MESLSGERPKPGFRRELASGVERLETRARRLGLSWMDQGFGGGEERREKRDGLFGPGSEGVGPGLEAPHGLSHVCALSTDLLPTGLGWPSLAGGGLEEPASYDRA